MLDVVTVVDDGDDSRRAPQSVILVVLSQFVKAFATNYFLRVIPTKWHFFSHIFWHALWLSHFISYIFCNSFWHSIWYIFGNSLQLRSDKIWCFCCSLGPFVTSHRIIMFFLLFPLCFAVFFPFSLRKKCRIFCAALLGGGLGVWGFGGWAKRVFFLCAKTLTFLFGAFGFVIVRAAWIVSVTFGFLGGGFWGIWVYVCCIWYRYLWYLWYTWYLCCLWYVWYIYIYIHMC